MRIFAPQAIPGVVATVHGKSSTFPRQLVNEQLAYPAKASGADEIKRPNFLIILTVFGLTGSSTTLIVKPILASILNRLTALLTLYNLSLWNDGTAYGMWVYQIMYFTLTFPLYSVILPFVGACFGSAPYFQHVRLRLWKRLWWIADNVRLSAYFIFTRARYRWAQGQIHNKG
jgi:hypothetical protein